MEGVVNFHMCFRTNLYLTRVLFYVLKVTLIRFIIFEVVHHFSAIFFYAQVHKKLYKRYKKFEYNSRLNLCTDLSFFILTSYMDTLFLRDG